MNEILYLGQIIICVGATMIVLPFVALCTIAMLSGQDGGGSANLIFVHMATEEKKNNLTERTMLVGFILVVIGIITSLASSF